ncbi:YhdP family protein [Rhodanobacter sp. Root480]|uniref:YhdP family protein n=1 Tax=Rhodanobacter sp. Root480 TaxID=1736542 RepID=UPI000AD27CF5|nr:YhdP family protein [Rhodanobacter sp. Root480]
MEWRRRWQRAARGLGWTAGSLLIALALMVALAQLLLPLVAHHPDWVAAKLSQRLQRPVSIEAMEGHRTRSGPSLVLHGVTIGVPVGESGSPLHIPSSSLKLDFGGWLWPSRHLFNLHVSGLQLDVLHSRDGRWHLDGIGTDATAQRQPVSLRGMSLDLWLNDVRVNVTDEALDRHYTLTSRQLRLSRRGGNLRVGGVLHRTGAAGSLSVVGRFSDDGSAGRLWLGADQVDLQAALQGVDMDGYTANRGHGRLGVWVDWRDKRIVGATARLDLNDVQITAPNHDSANVPALHGVASLRRNDDGYELRWAGDQGGALVLALHQPANGKRWLAVAARDLQLAPLLPWLALKSGLPNGVAQWLGDGRPHGELSRLAMNWSEAAGLRSIELAFKDVGIDAAGALPGVSGLRGTLRGDGEALSLELPVQATTLTFPHLFRQPLALSKLGGTLAFWPDGAGWHLGADALDIEGDGFSGQVRGQVLLPAKGGKPFVDLYAAVDRADVTATRLFLPPSTSPHGTAAWLDTALAGGTLDSAQVVLHGNLADWPFRHNEGRFEAHANISDLTLDYGHDEWPVAKGVDVVASFVNNGLLAEASSGQSLGVKVDKAVAVIPDYGQSLLDLNVSGHGAARDLLTFARQSPVARREADVLAKMKLGGSATFDFHLVLPLHDVQSVSLDGKAQLSAADLDAPDWNLALGKLAGPLRFDAHGLQVGPLSGAFHGQPSTLQLAVGAATGDPSTMLSASMTGRYTMAELVSDYPTLDWLGKLADGRSDFTVGFSIADSRGTAPAAQSLRIESSLDGTALDLPAPLRKPASGSLPLHVALTLPVDGSDVQLSLGQVMRGHLRLPQDVPNTGNPGARKPLAGALAFGSEMPTALPAKDLRILGHADTLDVTGWVQRAAAGTGGDGPGLESVDVSTEHAEWFGQPLGAMQIRANVQPDALSVDVTGAAMVGNFSIPRQELAKRGITARLQRLYWPKETKESTEPHKPSAAPAVAATPPAEPTPAPAVEDHPSDTGIAPASVPPLHLWVSDLRLGTARLGEARLESWPTADGMHIDQLRALSSRVQITGSGDWNGTASDSHTHMRIEFAAENLGSMLTALGYTGLFEGGKTHDELDASWPGSPSALALANMRGTLKVNVSDGRIPEVPPGMGRLFGLVSMAELPRRLTLDFGDVFGKGLAFDAITGDFTLADGNATTDNLVIQGPAARISISGRTGLRSRDYDQQVTVVPHVGNSLPIVGAVVAGPIGAAAGIAMQGLLGKGLNRAAGARYHVSGSWDKPVMTLIEKHDVPAPATTAPVLAPPYRDAGEPPAAGTTLLPAPASSAAH